MLTKKQIVEKINFFQKEKKYKPIVKLLNKNRHIISEDFYYFSLGYSYAQLKKYRSASVYFKKIAKNKSENHRIYKLLALVYIALKQPLTALKQAELAIEHSENDSEYIYLLSDILLQLGDFKKAWPAYEFRKLLLKEKYSLDSKMWEGQILENKVLLIYTEQGFGDSIQFIRYVPLVKEKLAKKIIILCENPLKNLFSRIEGVTIFYKGSQAASQLVCDYHIALHSLPFILDHFAIPIPLDFSRDGFQLRSNINKKFFNIGIAWRGSGTILERNIPMDYWRTIIKYENVKLHSLQIGDAVSELKNSFLRDKIIDHSEKIMDFSDTADLIQQMDLVITIDTSIAHLAGSLNTPTWILLNYSPCWRWLKKGSRLVWYPTVRTFVQRREGNWDTVFDEVFYALKLILKYRLFIS